MSAHDINVIFCELPPALRVGGLEAACRGLEQSLRAAGARVVTPAEAATLALDPANTVAHFHGLWSPAHARLAAEYRRRGIAQVVSPHGMLEPWAWRAKRWKKWPYFVLVEGPRLRRAGNLLATATQEAGRMARFFPRARIEAIPLGTDLQEAPDYAEARRRLGWSTTERVLLYLSRIHPKKGLIDLLQAAQQLDAQLPTPARIVIVGDGDEPYMGQCRAAAALLRNFKVEWHPAIWGAGKWDFLKGADLMCLPTYSENFGIVVLEACQVGTPVLTTDETPWAAIGEHGFGYVDVPGVEACARALQRFLADPIADARKRAAMHQWVADNYAWSALAPRYLAFYRSVLDNHRTAHTP